MTVNGIEKECVLEFLEDHQKREAKHVKEFNKLGEWIAVELEDDKRQVWEELRNNRRHLLNAEQGFIKELALLIGKRAEHNRINISGMFHVLPLEVI